MIIALFPNTQKSQSKNIAVGIREYLISRNVKLVAEDSDAVTLILSLFPVSIQKKSPFLFHWVATVLFYS